MKTRTFLLLASLATAAVGGCQHKNTLIVEADRAPGTDVSAPTDVTPPSPATTATAPAATVTPPVATAPVVTTTRATTPATVATTTAITAEPRLPALYVAADADEATRFRNWRPVANYYPSGHAIAGPVYRIIVPPPRSDRWDDVFATDIFQTVMTIPQIFGTPLWMLVTPPWTPVEYHGETFPPSYTVDDPLPYYQNEKVPGIAQMKR